MVHERTAKYLSPEPGTVHSMIDLDKIVRNGIPIGMVKSLKESVRMDDKSISDFIGITARTYHNYIEHNKVLDLEKSDRIYRLASMVALAEEVFEDEEYAHNWLRQPQFGLGGAIPLKMMESEAGASLIEDLLNRIEHGVY